MLSTDARHRDMDLIRNPPFNNEMVVERSLGDDAWPRQLCLVLAGLAAQGDDS